VSICVLCQRRLSRFLKYFQIW